MRTGSASLDKKFNASTDHPTEFDARWNGGAIKASLEQTLLFHANRPAIKDRIELERADDPAVYGKPCLRPSAIDADAGQGVRDMPGADRIKVDPLPRRGSSWPVRVALAGGLLMPGGAAFHATL